MSSQVEISNAAIIAVGGEIIASFNEHTPEAILIRTLWDQIRKNLLRLNSWNFAVKRVQLARSATPPNFDFSYRYALPYDNLRVLQVWTDDDYRIENGYITTNAETCFLKYIADIPDVNVWSSDFIDLMSARLSAEIAYAVTKDKGVTQMQWNVYTQKLNAALWLDSSEDIQDNFQFEHTLISARY